LRAVGRDDRRTIWHRGPSNLSFVFEHVNHNSSERRRTMKQ
jgi:hypothetical protein